MSVGLEAIELVRTFGGCRAVDGVSFQLDRGLLLAIFGPNGAGKSTLLRMLAGVLRPTSGQIRVAGEPARVPDREWRRRVGVVSHESFLHGHLTAEENLLFYGRLFGLPHLKERVGEHVDAMGLREGAGVPVADLSRGFQQRVALARALLHDPEVVLLDEPYTGLDQHGSRIFTEVLKVLKEEGRTVLLITHNLGAGLELCSRVVIQNKGELVLQASREQVEASEFERLYFQVVEGGKDLEV